MTLVPGELDSDAIKPALRAEIERWFVRRGVPQLVEGYSTEARLDARATPYIVAWLIIGTILYWGTRSDWPLPANAAATLATLAFIVSGYWVIRRSRGKGLAAGSGTFDLIDIAAFAVLPAIASALIEGSFREFVIALLNALLGIGIIYLVVVFGVMELALWAVGRLLAQLTQIVELVARTLPLLLILVAFLLFATEIWEVAGELAAIEVVAVILLLAAVAALLVVVTARTELRRLGERDWAAIAAEAADTPAAPLVAIHSTAEPPPVGRLGRVNLVALMLIGQLIRSVFVAVVVMGFLVIIGLIVVPEQLQVAWIGAPIRGLLEFELIGETRALSVELVNVTALLSGIVGLYFTALAVADPGHRQEHFALIVADAGELLAAYALYSRAVLGTPAVPGEGGVEPATS